MLLLLIKLSVEWWMDDPKDKRIWIRLKYAATFFYFTAGLNEVEADDAPLDELAVSDAVM